MRAITRMLAAACLLPVLALAEAGVAQHNAPEPDRTVSLQQALSAHIDAAGAVGIYFKNSFQGEVTLSGTAPTTTDEKEAELEMVCKQFGLVPVESGGFLQVVPRAEASTVASFVPVADLPTVPPSRYVVSVLPLRNVTWMDVVQALPPSGGSSGLIHAPTVPGVLVHGRAQQVLRVVRTIAAIDEAAAVVSKVIRCKHLAAADIVEALRQSAGEGCTVAAVGNQVVISGLVRDVDALAARLAELDR